LWLWEGDWQIRLIQFGIKFIWHGGEPLLRGIDFFKIAIEIQDSMRGEKDTTNDIHINATLIVDAFLDFFVCARV
jgi:uncharacterized protein